MGEEKNTLGDGVWERVGAQTMPVDISVARLVGGGGEEWDKCGAWEVIAGWWEVWMTLVREGGGWG